MDNQQKFLDGETFKIPVSDDLFRYRIINKNEAVLEQVKLVTETITSFTFLFHIEEVNEAYFTYTVPVLGTYILRHHSFNNIFFYPI